MYLQLVQFSTNLSQGELVKNCTWITEKYDSLNQVVPCWHGSFKKMIKQLTNFKTILGKLAPCYLNTLYSLWSVSQTFEKGNVRVSYRKTLSLQSYSPEFQCQWCFFWSGQGPHYLWILHKMVMIISIRNIGKLLRIFVSSFFF